MINEDPNMGRKQIFDELPLPSKVEEKGIFKLIYKGVFVAVKLLLDIRLNLVKISEGKKIQTVANSPVKSKNVNKTPSKVDNAVIKNTDNITVETKVDPTKMETIEKGAKLIPEKKSTFEEGSVKKGGVNTKPSSPRPSSPKGQGEKKDEETKS